MRGLSTYGGPSTSRHLSTLPSRSLLAGRGTSLFHGEMGFFSDGIYSFRHRMSICGGGICLICEWMGLGQDGICFGCGRMSLTCEGMSLGRDEICFGCDRMSLESDGIHLAANRMSLGNEGMNYGGKLMGIFCNGMNCISGGMGCKVVRIVAGPSRPRATLCVAGGGTHPLLPRIILPLTARRACNAQLLPVGGGA